MRTQPAAGARGRLSPPRSMLRAPADLAGQIAVRHAGREYQAWFRVCGDLLTVYCGAASNTGLLSPGAPSPTPLAERLLRELIDAEHPGLNPV